MIKEITSFINNLDPDFKALGMRPKDGLHILLRIQKEEDRLFIDNSIVPQSCYTGKKNLSEDDIEFLKYCNTLSQVAWMVDPNKCIDTKTRAIHSCSPYCLAIKKTNLENGENFKIRIKERKAIVYDSLKEYFRGAEELLEDDSSKQIAKIFADTLNSKEKLHSWLNKIESFNSVKDGEYIAFYVDYPLDNYQLVNEKYLSDKLFNTAEFTILLNEEKWGTSNFLNGFPVKKPFLTHRSATFDIAGRVSANEAKALFEFKALMDRSVFPRPLPIFINKDEIQKDAILLFRQSLEGIVKLSYQTIVESLYDKHKDELGNYYLIFYQAEEILDFDFVPKFHYEFKSTIKNYFDVKLNGEAKSDITIRTVFELENYIFKKLIGNKYNKIDYFKDLDIEDFSDRSSFPNEIYTNKFYSYSKYRKAIYDYIYKSKRQGINNHVFYDLVFNGIKDDLKYGNKERIKEKLNIWYSLYEMFNSNNNVETMGSKLKTYKEFIENYINGTIEEESITDQQFIFAAGQVIYYLLSKSKSEDQSYKLLEPYLQRPSCIELKKAIANDFKRYKHEKFSANFEKVASMVLSYETDINLNNYLPELLSGLFSKNQLFKTDKQLYFK